MREVDGFHPGDKCKDIAGWGSQRFFIGGAKGYLWWDHLIRSHEVLSVKGKKFCFCCFCIADFRRSH